MCTLRSAASELRVLRAVFVRLRAGFLGSRLTLLIRLRNVSVCLCREYGADQLGQACGAHFSHDLGAMRLDCTLRDSERNSDLFIGSAVHDKLHHITFPRSQRGKSRDRVRLPAR